MTPDQAKAERKKYVRAFNSTMVKIWKEKITQLAVIDTGALYNSVTGLTMRVDPDATSAEMTQSFLTYGLFVDYGTGSNTPRGNGGDIGRANPRRRRRWFSTKHYASVMNIREFWADSLGRHAATVISNALTRSVAARSGIGRTP